MSSVWKNMRQRPILSGRAGLAVIGGILGGIWAAGPAGILALWAEEALPQATDPWYRGAQATLQEKKKYRPILGPAKNVIFFIGDGMGVSTVTAARILDGQKRGQSGEENVLSWERFNNVALSKTYNTNQQVPDSAGTATAFLSGVKTRAGVIGIGSKALRGDCDSARGAHTRSLLEIAEENGLATGVVSTARLTHATPAAAYAHTPERNWESDANIPAAEQARGCKDIALQFLEFDAGDGIDVAFGGGRREFLPRGVRGPQGKKGKRGDGRDLVAEWRARHATGRYVWNRDQFERLDAAAAGPVLGLFSASHMNYEISRTQDGADEPSLADMTAQAIRLLQNKSAAGDKGYFLFVEGARVDHGHHDGNASKALHDTLALAEAVRKAVEMTDVQETLIVVSADHSHGFVMSGYPTRGNPILGRIQANDARGLPSGKDLLAKDGRPFTTLGYYSGPGAVDEQPRPDLSAVDTEAADFRQQALIPLRTEAHAGEDVAIYARGPQAHLFRGVVEQNYIFHGLLEALGLSSGGG